MRNLLVLAERLPQGARRVLIVLAGAGMGLYACATADALQQGDIAELLAGAALTALFAVLGALLWSTQRHSAPGGRGAG